ncbi:DUF2069 domain-containing protein [Alcaligenes sp. SDU_A2]|uniref:DUF2069 domain-containing protein n=1 Tax=Alcaligenes sp. SDU_A2 TaxID=3136634 RepID=UPI002C5C5927|nr:DUF2069 domain-containing protein [Alcaligenes sp.]HRL26025.1 DUF2069 domain-containing protein [Alcaligenes sp.]
MHAPLNPVLHRVAAAALVALIVLCLAWELHFAPLKPGGSWMALKVVPLVLPLRGVFKGNLYTLQWTSMMILLYFAEGIMRAWSDPVPNVLPWALGEIALTMVFYFCAIFYLWPAKKAAKQRAKAQKAGKAV